MEVTRYEVDMSEVSIFGTPKKCITVVQQAITSHTVLRTYEGFGKTGNK